MIELTEIERETFDYITHHLEDGCVALCDLIRFNPRYGDALGRLVGNGIVRILIRRGKNGKMMRAVVPVRVPEVRK